MTSHTTGTPPPAPRPTVAQDAAHVAPALTSLRQLATAPVSRATWRAVGQAVVGFPWLLVVFVLVAVLVPLSFGLTFLFGLGLLLAIGTILGGRALARAERARLRAQLGVDIPAPLVRRAPDAGAWARLKAVLGDGRGWAHLAYAAVAWLVVTITWSVAIGGFGFVLALLAYPVTAHVADLGAAPVSTAVYLPLALVLAWVTAVVTQALTLAQVRIARSLLGPSPRQDDDERVLAEQARTRAAEERAAVLTQTRTAAVGAADDERRRIERDLHDGAQQRLVALGVDLGVARRAAQTDPAAASAALEHAHREVKETLAELRDLVRGIHPAVLTDRGLDAALSALAARSPVPVTIDAGPDLDAAGPTAQAAAYFVAAEALTNAAKHAGARAIRVTARILDTGPAARLRLVVEDDGQGGASATPGGGLDGLRARVAALDGTFDLLSPAGRGTRVAVEVPCAS